MHVIVGVGRESITFNIRLSVYSRRIVFIQKVCSISVEMSSAAAAAAVNFFLFSLWHFKFFLCGFWHILCRALAEDCFIKASNAFDV